jgi:hypothetical protein
MGRAFSFGILFRSSFRNRSAEELIDVKLNCGLATIRIAFFHSLSLFVPAFAFFREAAVAR